MIEMDADGVAISGVMPLLLCLLALSASFNSALAMDVVLSAQGSMTLENCTFWIEDIDSEAGLVWLLAQNASGTPGSLVLGVNNSTTYSGLNLTVTAVYAGEKADLVCLRINSSQQSTRVE